MEKEENFKTEILAAYANLKKADLYVRTNIEDCTVSLSEFRVDGHNFYLKDETKQESGSFKFRGLLNQITRLTAIGVDIKYIKLLTFSAGNYGRSFAKMCAKMGIEGLVIMPDFAPIERSQFIESQEVRTERHSTDEIQSAVDGYIKRGGYLYFHPFDDIHLIYGHASFGLEILEELPHIDIAVVCCGGGGLLAATAMALKLFGRRDCVVYGVEPETANTMKTSFEMGRPFTRNDAKSIASGLSPPSAGNVTYDLCCEYVDDIILVSEDEILAAMVKLHKMGINAEPSGSAAMAAVMFHKIPLLLDSKMSLNVLIAVTGGNCSTWDFEYVNEHS